MFYDLIGQWFGKGRNLPNFIKCMLTGNVEDMNNYMNRIARETFSSFDTGTHPSDESEPERFYHGFVLGLMADRAADHWHSTSEQAAQCARDAGVGRLLIGHYSSRITDFDALLQECRDIFPDTTAGQDGDVIDF